MWPVRCPLRTFLLLNLLLPACNECSYWEQCDGNTLLATPALEVELVRELGG